VLAVVGKQLDADCVGAGRCGEYGSIGVAPLSASDIDGNDWRVVEDDGGSFPGVRRGSRQNIDGLCGVVLLIELTNE
jgi:hypothetical protein